VQRLGDTCALGRHQHRCSRSGLRAVFVDRDDDDVVLPRSHTAIRGCGASRPRLFDRRLLIQPMLPIYYEAARYSPRERQALTVGQDNDMREVHGTVFGLLTADVAPVDPSRRRYGPDGQTILLASSPTR